MSAKNFMWPVLFLLSAVILSCDGSALLDDFPADGDGSAQLLYRDCLRNGDCESRMCVEARNQAIGFCSMPCSRDAECEDVLAFTCCEVKGGYCKPPSRCVGDEPPDGDEPDGDATDGDLDEETDGDGNSDGDSDDYWDVCCATSLECCLEHGDICGERCDWAQGRCTRHEHCPEDYVCAADGWCARKPPRPDGDEPDGDTDGDEQPETCQTPCTAEAGCAKDSQYCFREDPGSDRGCCITYCDLPDAPSCPRGFTCRHGACVPIPGFCRDNAACREGEFCYKIPGQPDGFCAEYCFNEGQWCPTHATCITNREDPNYGKCVHTECGACNFDQQCTGDPNFGPGFYCNIPPGQTSGCCIQMCGNDNPCHRGFYCDSEGRCQEAEPCDLETGICAPGFACLEDAYCHPYRPCLNECSENFRCNTIYGLCEPDCPPTCPEGQYCDAQTAPDCAPQGVCINPIVCNNWSLRCCFGYRCASILYGAYGYCI